MTDLVERLREIGKGGQGYELTPNQFYLIEQAANEIERLRGDAERLRKCLGIEQNKTAGLRSLLRQCDEAMSWDLGGEPLPSLMIAARKAILEELGPAPSAGPEET
jgi:hypothetical protein